MRNKARLSVKLKKTYQLVSPFSASVPIRLTRETTVVYEAPLLRLGSKSFPTEILISAPFELLCTRGDRTYCIFTS